MDIGAFKQAVKRSGSRYVYLAYAFVRGIEHAHLERRVSEHNLPSPWALQVAIGRVLGEKLAEEQPYRVEPSPEVKAWLAVPEERIKRFGPRVPRPRPVRATEAAE